MGVPKFFRYISERYPCLSEVVKEYQIPEFDNLYLDMNGIIHMCSHPDDGNPHFRITEEKIFKDIFHYIEVLFRMIRPQKVFFMAVDGVAPRAKMNQQRGRRFRSAKDAQKQEEDAKKKGETLPSEARFDSNCITPGTVFMARLHEQLKYFVVDKISNDPTWQKCKVILSGHETPGEGEHKIMDYIRYMRAQPGYDPNTRHCLYGLDADLIMLGLCTHEPHFSLLREEVKFGRKSTKRMSVPEEITFYLLHLSLMREYLELEFYSLKDRLRGFDYDLEKVIDDWVLMGFLVGNDFIPHLPNLHIANGALPILYKAYMDILPTLDGYINEGGTLNLVRFEKFMEKLGDIDVENFEEIRDDLLYMEAKTGRKWNAHMKVSTKNLEEWDAEDEVDKGLLEPLEPEKPRDSGLAALIKETDDMCLDSADETEDQSEEDDAFENYKKDYYRNKLEYANVTAEVMRDQAEGYVRAIQWNLNYYYNGCCSWSWYYPHHYAPYISDIKGFSNLKIEFDSGRPFLPFEQLLAVLPAASKELLPACYHPLMTDDDSLIKRYYPEDFQTDLNGKKQEWEAVVLVPFIDEGILLEAMKVCNDLLTPEEKKRNSHGPMLIYSYTEEDLGKYPAPEYFPPIPHDHAIVVKKNFDDVLVAKEKLVKGAYPGCKMDVYYPGFPTMKHLKYKAYLKAAKIRVFESPSRNENMIVQIIPDEKFSGEMIPVDLLGTSVFVGWPHLVEAKVVAISNSKRKYVNIGQAGEYNYEDRTGPLVSQFEQEINSITEFYKRRWGIEVGDTNVLVHAQVMIGRRYVFSPNGRVTLEKQFAQQTSNYPLQAVVFNIAAYDSLHSTFRDLENVFPKGCSCFTLTNPYYGSRGVVEDCQISKNGRIKISVYVQEEPDFTTVKELHARIIRNYKTLHHAASALSVAKFLFSRLTGSIFVNVRNNEGGFKSVSIGLDLKFNKRNKETPGYTKKIANTWYYTDRAVELVKCYGERFPEVLNYLSHENADEINAEDIFKENCDEKMKELLTWLKSLPVHAVERQTCYSEVIEPEIVEELERIIDKCPTDVNVKKVTMQIKPSFLYRPEVQSGTLMPDPKTETKVLDRIVNVRSDFTVPLGLKGTVISVHKSTTGSDRDVMYDVVFDKQFSGGMRLNCSENRGYRLPTTAFINISYGQRLLEQRTGNPGIDIARAEACQPNAYGQNNYRTPNFSCNNFVPQQVQQQPQPQQHMPFQKENSAFAQFSAGFRQPYASPQYNNGGHPQNFYPPSAGNKPARQAQNYVPQQSNQNVSNGRSIAQGPAVYQKSDNNFMPTFGNKEREVGKSVQHSPEKKAPKVRQNSEAQENTAIKNVPTDDANRALRPSINTEYLKSMLKIGGGRPNTHNGSSKGTVSAASTSKKDDRPDSIQFDIFAQAANAPASVRLLTYYQSNGLGLPRYLYFNQRNSTQSQIILPTGEQVTGRPARTREEASENVAALALDELLKKKRDTSSTTKSPDSFPPVPPETWVQPAEINDRSRNDDRRDDKQTKTAGKSRTDTAVLNNSFVPLQAIKSHISKVNNTSNRQPADDNALRESIEIAKSSKLSKNISRDSQKGQDMSTQDDRMPRRERKTRIAANFIAVKK